MSGSPKQLDFLTRRSRLVRARPMAEITIQIGLVERLRWLAHPDVCWLAIPNGELRDARTGSKLKAMGVQPGAGDMLLIRHGRALFLELKRLKGRQSAGQAAFADLARRAGADYELADSLEGATALLLERGILKPAMGL